MNYKEFLKKFREKQLKKRKPRDKDKPIAVWMQDDIYRDFKIGKSLTIILRTEGCYYAREGGCLMCSYLMDSSPEKITAENLINQFNYAIEKYKEKLKELKDFSVKIFTSGSFLDDREVSKEVRVYIIKKLSEFDNLKEVAIESRAEFIDEEKLKEIRKYLNVNVEIGVGIESFNEEIREKAINKGITNEQIIKAIELAEKYNIGIKAYLFIKPLFITEKEAIEDAIYSANKCIELGCSRISFCPATVHKGSLMEYFFNKNQYRPPFLWSIIEILKEVKENNPNALIMCDTSGVGSERGAHNIYGCRCNKIIKEKIEKFTLTQDLSVLNIDCECKKIWEAYIEAESKNIVPLGDERKL
ncbi:archaeosine biosynthesis radical SAM protein RaSEA [Methanocaldococcus fervens]|uniref:Radical SAM domain protein n=1 Tax=Methanocaldococcus fervens (strain DSM 4213 / JCM 15782 / AG86) TaxID=573064 RepID=C7P7T2_METFA|nr:archaeosine biosynthesis radical SAM protein RaSEA [Methanocaldococcus fervens]ACV24614.1 Radical SAM domain protein [Methanocaldococcus fervens AG86]